MKLTVNGREHSSSAPCVAKLVTELDLEPRMVLIEHNGQALHRKEWETTRLDPGDKIEILRVVAGG